MILLRCLPVGIALAVVLSGCSSGDSTDSITSTTPNPTPPAPACEQSLWVSPEGSDDTGSGAAAAPFRTLERAQLALRAHPQRGRCTLAVNLVPGTYRLARTFELGAEDSGTAEHRVVFRTAPGSAAPAVISGGVPVAFNCNGAECIAPVEGLPQGLRPRQFYVNGARAVRARSNPAGPVNPLYSRVDAGYRGLPLTHPELVEAVSLAQWKMMRCPVAAYVIDTLVMQQPCWNNANSFNPPWNFQLLSWLENAPEFMTEPNMWYFDPYARTLSYRNPGASVPTDGVLPVLETLVSVSGTPQAPITGISFEGLVFAHAGWTGPNGTSGYVADQSGVLLQGEGYGPAPIGHQKTVYPTPGNIVVRHARDITFDGNTFRNLGAVALWVAAGARDVRITQNTFSDIASAAIQLGGVGADDARPQPGFEVRGTLVQDNDIAYTGQDYYDSAAIFVGFAQDTLISHNTIRHVPWSALAIGWGWGLYDQSGFPGLPGATPGLWGSHTTPTAARNNRIVSNRFESFLEKLWDGGAIYANGMQGPDQANGLLIQLNVAQDKRPAAGGNIYYTDGGARFITLDRNVSVGNPVGTVDFGPCLAGSSLALELCAVTGLVPYGSDIGGCLPVGDLVYTGNYFLNPVEFFGPTLCKNPAIPPAPVNVLFSGNVPVRTSAEVPAWILQQAGRRAP